MKKIPLTFKELKSILALSLFLVCVFTSYSQDTDIPESVAEKIADGVYVHERWGTNITISSGKDGLLIIDSGAPGSAAYTDSVIREGFNAPVKYLVNTHLHFDHVGGNHLLSKGGAVIIAHENTRRRMMQEWRVPKIPEAPEIKFPVVPPFPEEYLPMICFNDSIVVHVNDELIRCIHIPGGHSDCDVVVKFRNANVIHTGDLFLSNGYPPIEGTTAGYLAGVDELIRMCDENTIVIPGHGPVSDRSGLKRYKEMLTLAANRINTLKSDGKTLEDIILSNPLAGLFDGKSYVSEELFIYCVYNNGITY